MRKDYLFSLRLKQSDEGLMLKQSAEGQFIQSETETE